MKRARGSTGLIALMLLLAVGCSDSSAPRSGESPNALLTIVNPTTMPPGHIVLLNAGPNSLNGQIIRVDLTSGKATRLTIFPENQGVSTISASGTKVVFAAALLGQDHPYRLNADGTNSLLSSDSGFHPIVAPSGDIAWARPAKRGNSSIYEIHVLTAGKTKDQTVYVTPLPVIAGAWLSGNRLAVFAPGSDAQIQILSVRRRKITNTIKLSPRDAGYLAATPSGDFAVGNKTDETLIRSDGGTVALPKGWHPFAFSPDGNTVLVARQSAESQNELGLVSVADPARVTVWARLRLASLLDAAWTTAA